MTLLHKGAPARNARPPVLYLDYDGVLHPDAAFVFRGKGVVLMREGHALFECVPILERILDDFPAVRIVLATSWVQALDFSRAKARLSAALQCRVIGATFHRRHMNDVAFQMLPRGVQILADAQRRGCRWVAIDNDDELWPASYRDRLVLTDPETGLLDTTVQRRLREKLEEVTC
ncbi:MAG: hypothetical protein E6R14_08665 [Thermomicrobiales bacterium]|jgi:hypothetical protein|nr:MAG: hypothetical protein E6R14_08665 [Thermomicrobiales bacterium]